MPDKFQIGELVIIQNSDYWIEHDGVPAVVIGPYTLRLGMDLRDMQMRHDYTYDVRVLVDPPRCVCTRPDQMRKLHDDPGDHVTECEKEREPAVPATIDVSNEDQEELLDYLQLVIREGVNIPQLQNNFPEKAP